MSSKYAKQLRHSMDVLGLPVDKLDTVELGKLREVLAESTDVFALDDSELGCTSLVQHSIDTGDHPPVKQPPYRTPVVYREKIEQMVNDMRKQGVVKPSHSSWASPIVLVPKKDGSLRFCVDYRRLNSLTRKDVYPLPRVEDILDTLGEAKYFTSLDLASGYWQVELDSDARAKSVFTTHHGLFEFIRMYRCCAAPNYIVQPSSESSSAKTSVDSASTSLSFPSSTVSNLSTGTSTSFSKRSRELTKAFTDAHLLSD